LIADSRDLLERDTELARIEGAVAGACAGAGSVVLVEGPAGIGKTALLRRATEIAAERMTVLSARATQLEREFPFGAVRQLLEPPLRAAAPERRSRLLDGAASHAAPALGLSGEGSLGTDPGFATLNGLYWLVSDLAEERPLLLVLDDAHWADRDSLRFLAFLGPRLSELPALLVAAARIDEWDADAPFAATASDPVAKAVVPPPLSAAASATLVDSHLEGGADPAFVRACHSATGGNPFYLRALLDELRRDGVAPTEDAADLVLGLGPHAVGRVLVARLGSLSPAAPRLVRAVAVLGEDADPRHAAELAEIDPAEARRAAAELANAAILEPTESLRFTHPIIRNAVYEDIGHLDRAVLHGRAVEVLGFDESAAERIPGHLLAVEPAASAAVVETLRSAAAAALGRGALDSAVAYLRRALDEPPGEAERPGVMLELGLAEAQILDPRAPERLESAAATAGDPLSRGTALASLGIARYLQGDSTATAEALREALDLIPPGAGGNAEAYLLLTRFMAGRAVPELAPEVAGLLDQPRSGPDGEATPGEAARMQAAAFDAFLRGDRGLALQRLDRAEELLEGVRRSLPVTLMLGAFQSVLDRHVDAAPNLDAAFERARTRGSPMLMALALEGRTYLRWITGDLAGAIADGETRLRLGGEEWDPATTPVRAMLALCLVERGELAAATSALELPAGVEERLRGMWGWLWLPLARARLALERGEWARARDHALTAGERLSAIAAPSPDYMPWRSIAAVALTQLGDRDRALEIALEQLELGRRADSPRAIATGLAATGSIAGGDREVEALREAVSLLEGSAARLDRARALVDLGAALRRSGARADAREPLAAGMDLARECGAAPLAERAYIELRATGARPRKPDYAGVEALTPSELRVARMAADGLTNREIAQRLFVTVKTVEFHLGQTYRKLEISSREELGGALGK